MKRVLIVRLGAIGDVIMATPLLEEIWKRHADCHVDWIVGNVAAPILEAIVDPRLHLLRVDERSIFHGGPIVRIRAILEVWIKLGSHRYDRILMLNSDSRYGILPLWCRGPRRWFRPGGGRGLVPGRHHSVEYVRMLTGIDDFRIVSPKYPSVSHSQLPKEIDRQLQGKQPIVAISPAGARNVMREEGLRRWQLEGYRQVARSLRAKGCMVVLVGGPGDEWCSQAMAEDCDLDLVGKLDLSTFLSILSRVDVLVTHDSGPLHMADFVGIPSVGIFGPTLADEKSPISTPFRVVTSPDALACRPCYDGRNYAICSSPLCMSGITPEVVVANVLDLLP